MGRPRTDLQNKLVELLGTRNVYFQPPEGFKLSYPCILYNLTFIGKANADNKLYKDQTRYEVTIIDEDPDSPFYKELIKWNYSTFNRFYTADHLNHWVFELYF